MGCQAGCYTANGEYRGRQVFSYKRQNEIAVFIRIEGKN